MVGNGSTVVVNRRYRAGDCLGVYGGRIAVVSEEVEVYMPLASMLEVPLGKSTDDSRTSARLSQCGDNVLAQALTLLDEEGGQPCAQAKHGYNVDAAQFKVQAEDGRYLFITALFALTDLDPEIGSGGEALRPVADLRWDYGSSSKDVSKMLKQTAEAHALK